jgi:predicted ester cyclase
MKFLFLLLLTSSSLFASQNSVELVQQLIRSSEEEQQALLSPNLRIHDLASGEEVSREYAKACLQEFANAFDQNMEIVDIFAGEDRVVVHWRWTGIHTLGEYYGIAPTYRTVSVSGINLYRVEEDKIAEIWGNGFDRLHIVEELSRSN